jgi:hypothetical protein
MIWIFDVKNSVTGTEFLCRDNVGKCIVKLNRKCLFETSKPTYYDCGKYLLRKISLHGKYALCEIVEYRDFAKSIEYRDFAKSIEYRDFAKSIDVSEKECVNFDSLVTDPDFDFSFHIDTLQYRCGKIFFESNEKDTNFYPFLESKYVTNRFFLPF